ncbi:MAG: hypothetical protein ABW068_16125, partial [Candidatus Thiodiazotropha sp.]
MRNITTKAVDRLSCISSREFIPLSHSNALNRYGVFEALYDPYDLPDTEEREELEEMLLFGGMRVFKTLCQPDVTVPCGLLAAPQNVLPVVT